MVSVLSDSLGGGVIENQTSVVSRNRYVHFGLLSMSPSRPRARLGSTLAPAVRAWVPTILIVDQPRSPR